MIGRTYFVIGGIAVGLVLAGLATVWHRGAVQDTVDQAVRDERGRQTAFTTQALLEAERRNWDLQTKAAIAELENRVEQDRLKDMARAAAERARTADDRLQLATADLRRRAAAAAAAARPGSFADEAAAAASALGECSGRYRALGAVADGLSVQVIGLQRYVGIVLEVCFPNPPPR